MEILVSGRIIGGETHRRVAEFLVEAWTINLRSNRPVEQAGTHLEGIFSMEIEEERLRELFQDRPPELYVKVFRSDELLASTEDSIVWRLDHPPAEIVDSRGGRLDRTDRRHPT